VFCTVWLAFEYDLEQAWPYLMWFNMGEPAISPHLSEILIEAIDNFEAQVKLANWQANASDDRLVEFFRDFRIIPAQNKIQPLLTKLLAEPSQPETGLWLATFCQNTADNDSETMRPWRLLTAAWYASCFDPSQGLTYLRGLADGARTLTQADNELLMAATSSIDGLATMIQLIADCPDPAVKTMLKDFGHPDLPKLAVALLQNPPEYDHLANSAAQAGLDAETFHRNLAQLEKEEITATPASSILDLACGPLAPQTVLFSSLGYSTLGVDLHIPPGYLPLPGVKLWFRRNQHAKAWKAATEPYYQALADSVSVEFNWKKVKIELADLTRLDLADGSFNAVFCVNYLQHALDVDGLLAETARILKPGGVILADIWPYAALHGAFQYDDASPWSHLREETPAPAASEYSLNKWREDRFRQTFDKYFAVEQWLLEEDEAARSQLTTDIRSELAGYDEDELIRKRIVILARKR
jgi:SAM-dependent methyltransferase